jgi:amino acid adenylation domain-containing protein
VKPHTAFREMRLHPAGTDYVMVRQAESSSAQDGLWFLEKLNPNSAVSTVCRAYRVSGRLVLDALREAWRDVVGRHDILRTELVEQDGRPTPRPTDATVDELSWLDLSDRPDPSAAAELWSAGLASTPLRLAAGPLARLAVARLADAEHLVVLVLHRAVCDADSVPILVDELSTAYEASAAGVPVREALPARPGQYADHARAQRNQARTPAFQRLGDRWISALTPLPSPPALPVNRARPVGLSAGGGSVRFEWAGPVAGQLAELSTVEGTAPSTVLLAAFQALLHRYTGEDRVTVGRLVVARPRLDFTGVVGPFENLLVLCGDLAGRPTFRELVGRVARQAAEAEARRWLPFPELVRALEVDRDPRLIPLCNAVFTCQDSPEPTPRLAEAVVRRQPVHNGSALADLVLSVELVAPAVRGELEFRDGLLDRDSAEAILDQLHTLLAAGLAEPDRRVAELPLDSAERTEANLREADRIAVGGAPTSAAHELFHRQAALRQDGVALVWQDEAISYGELARRAAEVTSALTGQTGVGGATVVVRMPTGPDQIAALLGVLDAGADLACLGPGDAGERGRAVLTELRPACLVLDGDGADDDLARWYRTELGGRVLDVTALGEAAAPADVLPARLDTRAYVTHTSGSTGRPKGIPQSHATFAQFVTWFSDEFGIGPGARVAQWAAPGYDASLIEVFAALAAGATLCPVPDRIRANPERVVDWLSANEITVFQTVPSFARQLLGVLPDRGGAGRLAALDCLLLAGEALPGELANQVLATLPGARLVNLYGPTESILATWHEVSGPVHDTTVPIGRSIPGRAVLVLDEHGRPCPAGVTGQIVISSPYLTEGYLGEAAEERSAFAPFPSSVHSGRTYRTGDLGRLRWDGALEFLGRKDFQVKFNGMRMELTDIEAALRAHESVADCAVVALSKADGLIGRLVAYVVPRRDETGKPLGAADTWRAALRRRFGKAMPPVSFQTILDLPRTISGKVDRRALPAPGITASGPPRAAVLPDLAVIWSESLGGRDAAPEVSFFAAGGHSLLIVPLLRRIRERFEVEVPLWDFFANPTLAGLSAFVDAHLGPETADSETFTG